MKDVMVSIILVTKLILLCILNTRKLSLFDIVFVLICIITQWMALFGIYYNKPHITTISHYGFGFGTIIGSLLVDDRSILMLLFTLLTITGTIRYIKGECMYDSVDGGFNCNHTIQPYVYVYIIPYIIILFRLFCL